MNVIQKKKFKTLKNIISLFYEDIVNKPHNFKLYAKYDLNRMKDMDAYIGIRASTNTAELVDITSEKKLKFKKNCIFYNLIKLYHIKKLKSSTLYDI